MKKALVVVGVLVALVAAALVALPMMVPAERLRDEMVAGVKAATGRDLSIQGKVAVSVLPSLSVQLSNVALSNPPGFSTKDLVRLGAVDVRLKLLPVLSGRVEVDSFVLIDPVVTLETNRQGRGNWSFDDGKAKAPPKPGAEAGGGAPGIGDIRLGDVRIGNGRLIHIDGKTGAKEEVTDINLAVSLPSLDAPMAVKGGLKWRAKPIDIALDLAKPRALIDGQSSEAGVSLAGEPLNLAFKGRVDAGKTPGVDGALDLKVPSIRGLVQWATAKPLEAPGTGLGPLSIKGRLAAAGTRLAFTEAAIAVDAITAAGDLTVETGGARPAIKGRLAVDTLDLNPYLPPEGKPSDKPAPKAAKGQNPGGQGAGGWSDDPIDVAGLKAADVDFALTVAAIKVRALQVGKSALHLTIANGRMLADLTELALYGGGGKGRLAVDGTSPGVGLDAQFALDGLQAEPFLKDAAGTDRIEGTAAADVAVRGRGASQRQLIASLAGKGRVSFRDGAIKGVNLAEMVRNVASAFTQTGGAQKTDFAELGGTFTITDGIVTNKDLALASPLFRLEGAGTVDLPRRALSYRLEPKAVASLEGQGAGGEAAGLMVPVIVEGPWDDLSYKPDLAALVKGGVGKAVEGAIGGKLPEISPGNLPGALPQGPLDPRKLFGR